MTCAGMSTLAFISGLTFSVPNAKGAYGNRKLAFWVVSNFTLYLTHQHHPRVGRAFGKL